MNANDTYLAIFLGSKTSPKRKAWDALPEAERRAKEREGIAAWKAWAEKHQGAIVGMGGPVGKTEEGYSRRCRRREQRVAERTRSFAGLAREPAAKTFENHPHLALLPWQIRGGACRSCQYPALNRRRQPLAFWCSVPALAAEQPLTTAVASAADERRAAPITPETADSPPGKTR